MEQVNQLKVLCVSLKARHTAAVELGKEFADVASALKKDLDSKLVQLKAAQAPADKE